ncbi:MULTISPECIES: hypothetical protein, partial [Klebsiella]
NTTDALALVQRRSDPENFSVPSGVCEGGIMQKPKKKPLVVKKRSWHPAVMANLMRQAQEEDYRREQMAELERSARSHFADIGGEDGG